MLLMDFESFCTDSTAVWSVVGWLLMVFKIVIPILMIVFGSVDFGKAVIGQAQDEIKKAGTSLAFRAAAAVIIFILPTVVTMIINWAMEVSNTDMDYDTCINCVNHPSQCGK